MSALPFASALDGLIGLGRELITDKDKQIEFEYKARELQLREMEALLGAQTTPKVDAVVKLLYALIALFRPLGAAAMTAFGMWCHYKQIDMDTGLQIVFDGAFLGWGASRHANKQTEAKRKQPDIFAMQERPLGGGER